MIRFVFLTISLVAVLGIANVLVQGTGGEQAQAQVSGGSTPAQGQTLSRAAIEWPLLGIVGGGLLLLLLYPRRRPITPAADRAPQPARSVPPKDGTSR